MLHRSITGTILVADDQAANRELLEELLTPQGCKVVTVADGAAALEELTRAQFDLVLLDVMMPHLNGFEVCEKIKNNPDTYLIPVIMITALSDKQDRIEGIRVGADDFLSRPLDRTELLARVRSLLKLKQRTDELERAESVLFSLARSIEGKDPYTHGHCERLSDYSARLGEHLSLPQDQLIALRRAGVVHDVGKIAVPDGAWYRIGVRLIEEMPTYPTVRLYECWPLPKPRSECRLNLRGFRRLPRSRFGHPVFPSLYHSFNHMSSSYFQPVSPLGLQLFPVSQNSSFRTGWISQLFTRTRRFLMKCSEPKRIWPLTLTKNPSSAVPTINACTSSPFNFHRVTLS